jgi:hypothetical protein
MKTDRNISPKKPTAKQTCNRFAVARGGSLCSEATKYYPWTIAATRFLDIV